MISNHEQCFPKMTRLGFILSSIQTTKTESREWGWELTEMVLGFRHPHRGVRILRVRKLPGMILVPGTRACTPHPYRVRGGHGHNTY